MSSTTRWGDATASTRSMSSRLIRAKLALFGKPYAHLPGRVEHISLAADPRFQETYVEEMSFPAAASLT
jgi:hypothetical protein